MKKILFLYFLFLLGCGSNNTQSAFEYYLSNAESPVVVKSIRCSTLEGCSGILIDKNGKAFTFHNSNIMWSFQKGDVIK